MIMPRNKPCTLPPTATEIQDIPQHEARVFRPMPRILAEAGMSPQDIAQQYAAAQKDLPGFWEEAAEELAWFRKWDTVLDDSQAPSYRWFVGARCNIVYNALDRHVETANKNKLALIWEGEPGDTHKLTYYELYRQVNKTANMLRACGVGMGDRVLIHLPPLPETVITMLAAAKIGAVHSVVPSGLSAQGLCERINNIQPTAIITVDGFYRNGHVIALKHVVDEATAACSAQSVAVLKHILVVHRALVETTMQNERDLWFHDSIRKQPDEAPTVSVDAAHPLFILHTSVPDSVPRGIVHTHGGYMVGVFSTQQWIFDIKATDLFWCTADPAKGMGHGYMLYGPLMAGTTTLLYEGHPLYPEPGRIWSIVERWGITVLYTLPTLIRMLMQFGNKVVEQYALGTLRLLATTGESLTPDAWAWLHKQIGRGRCPVLDTWWQAETGMCMIAPRPVSPLKPGSVARPLPGIDADVVDTHGTPLAAGEEGYLVIKKPWPAMLSAVHNAPEAYGRYWSRFPGWYCSENMARKDEDGYLWIQGRADDVLLIGGHRIGLAELEAALNVHPAVTESAVIGMPDAVRGQVAQAFIVLHEPQQIETEQAGDNTPATHKADMLAQDLVTHVQRELGPLAIIRTVTFCTTLPKTPDGKPMRHILRSMVTGICHIWSSACHSSQWEQI